MLLDVNGPDAEKASGLSGQRIIQDSGKFLLEAGNLNVQPGCNANATCEKLEFGNKFFSKQSGNRNRHKPG